MISGWASHLPTLWHSSQVCQFVEISLNRQGAYWEQIFFYKNPIFHTAAMGAVSEILVNSRAIRVPETVQHAKSIKEALIL